MHECSLTQFYLDISLTVYCWHSFTLCQSCVKLLLMQTECFLLPVSHKSPDLLRHRAAFIVTHPQEM